MPPRPSWNLPISGWSTVLKKIDRECAGQECSTADIAAVGGWVTRMWIFVAKALERALLCFMWDCTSSVVPQ